MRFLADQHLRRRTEFEAVRRNAFRFEDGLFLFQSAALRHPDERPRLGVIATRRLGNAVTRNRAKRILRELFRLNQSAIPGGSDLVLLARPKLLRAVPKDRQARFLKACQTYARWREGQSS